MANKLKPDTDLGNAGSPDFEEMQQETKRTNFRQQLIKQRTSVPTRTPSGFPEQFQVIDTGNSINSLYAFLDNQWKPINELMDFTSSDTKIENTSSEKNLHSFTLRKNALPKNAILNIVLPVVDLDLKSGSSQNKLTFKVKLDSTTLQTFSITNTTASDITNDQGKIEIDIANDGGKSTQAVTSNLNTDNFIVTEQDTGSFDTTSADMTVKITATFEASDLGNIIEVTNKKAKITT